MTTERPYVMKRSRRIRSRLRGQHLLRKDNFDLGAAIDTGVPANINTGVTVSGALVNIVMQ